MGASRFQDFVQFAIDNEVTAAELYEKYAAIVQPASSRRMLEDMAKMERGHEAKLTEFVKTGVAYFSKIGVIEDMHISDYMMAEELNADSSIEDVFVFAMKAEHKAWDLYSRLGGLETEPKVQELFRTLADEEKKHKHDLEVEYEKQFMNEN